MRPTDYHYVDYYDYMSSDINQLLSLSLSLTLSLSLSLSLCVCKFICESEILFFIFFSRTKLPIGVGPESREREKRHFIFLLLFRPKFFFYFFSRNLFFHFFCCVQNSINHTQCLKRLFFRHRCRRHNRATRSRCQKPFYSNTFADVRIWKKNKHESNNNNYWTVEQVNKTNQSEYSYILYVKSILKLSDSRLMGSRILESVMIWPFVTQQCIQKVDKCCNSVIVINFLRRPKVFQISGWFTQFMC